MDLERKPMNMGQTPALLIVDMINAFTDPACPLGTDAASVVEANRMLLTAFRARSLPIVYTTVIFRCESEGRAFRNRVPALEVLQPDSEWVKVDRALEPLAGEYITEKKGASAFFGTDLATWPDRRGADSVVVTGLTTSGCVRASVVDGLQHDYPVFVPRQAVGDRNPNAHEANLFDMHAKYADVLDLAELLAMLPGNDTQSRA